MTSVNVFKIEGFDGYCLIQMSEHLDGCITLEFKNQEGDAVSSTGILMAKEQAAIIAKALIKLSGEDNEK